MSDDVCRVWLRRARSNLSRAELGRQQEEILYEDLCFDAQQAAEKALKGLMASLKIRIPRTHSIGFLLRTISRSGKVQVPKKFREAVVLTDYAVTTRYPGDWEALCHEDYEKAICLAREIYLWACSVANEERSQ